MKKVMVKLDNVKKDYEGKEIIKGISLDIYEGEFLTLLGPSGCGKTTLLRTISGLEMVSSGKVYIDGEEVTDVIPRKREVNTIFQNFALFSHMTVEKNIAFGLKMKKVPNVEIKKRVKDIIKLIRMEGYEERKPNQLSGGQQQRVALARGLVNNPKVLLLDEPLSSLDMKLRKEMEIELKRLQKKMGITFIYVTHDQDEALSMSDRVAIINNGIIEQIDTPKNIYDKPKTRFVADFIGESNQFAGVVISTSDSKAIIKLDIDLEIEVINDNYDVGQEITVVIRPEQFKLARANDITNCFYVKVKDNVYNGTFTKVIGKVGKKEIQFIIYNDEDYDKNEELKLKFKTDDLVILEEVYEKKK